MSLTVFGASRPSSIHSQFATASQVTPLSDFNPNGRDTIENLPTAIWRGRRFVLEEMISRKGSRGRTSWIRKEGLFVQEILADNKPGDVFWICRRCDEDGSLLKPLKSAATTATTDHLKKKHRIEEHNITDSSSSSQANTTPAPFKRPRNKETLHTRSYIQKLEELLLAFLINNDLPFSVFEDPYIREFSYQLEPDVTSQISWSRTRQRHSLKSLFNSKKGIIQAEMHNAITRIHLGFDLWTSPNRLAIMAVTGHFLDHSGKQQQRLLALRQQSGAHTGENLANTLLQAIQDWDINNRIGTVISDNASNNDTCTRSLFHQLDPRMTSIDAEERRMRCYGHILNLVGRAFLYHEDSEAFEQESQLYYMADRLDDDLRHWRKKGPVGKLHNIVTFIRASPQRSEQFKKAAEEVNDDGVFTLSDVSSRELELVTNNETRWNSTYLMIERALLKRAHIQAFINDHQFGTNPQMCIHQDDVLSHEDWRILIEIKAILEPLYMQTMRCQGWGKGGSHGRLWEVLAGIEFLLQHLEDWKAIYTSPTDEEIEETESQMQIALSAEPRRSQRTVSRLESMLRPQSPRSRSSRTNIITTLPVHTREEYLSSTLQSEQYSSLRKSSKAYLRLSITIAWQKLNDYYIRLGESPLFAAAIILNPEYNIRWLERMWDSDEQLIWLRDAKKSLTNYWERWYSHDNDTNIYNQPSNNEDFLTVALRVKENDPYEQWLGKSKAQPLNNISELEKYLDLDLQGVEDPVKWWISQQQAFPTLSKLALDLLAVPAMAADCERAFSLCKLTLSSQRLSMRSSTLEMLQCLKNWLRTGAISLGGGFAIPKRPGSV
ncbi:Putative AC9 transposase-like protein [Cladobotryum mycophilum]|uniref:AC9 transposase-like protein n=1 Tax=Cladobotryum mycophilum TaxID=491253 RepID=A0ABR0SSM8_9HYPO